MILLTSTGESLFQLVVVLFVFVVVLALTYYTTRWIAGYQKAHTVNNNLAVVETLKLTTNKYIPLIRVGKDKYYVLAVGKDEISVVGQLTKEELQQIPDVNVEDIPTVKGDFEDVLKKMKERLPKK